MAPEEEQELRDAYDDDRGAEAYERERREAEAEDR